jgi:hypothetical protein
MAFAGCFAPGSTSKEVGQTAFLRLKAGFFP